MKSPLAVISPRTVRGPPVDKYPPNVPKLPTTNVPEVSAPETLSELEAKPCVTESDNAVTAPVDRNDPVCKLFALVMEPDVSGPAVLIELAAVKSDATLICPAFNKPVTETLPAVKPPLIEALARFTAPVWKEPACRAPVTESELAVTAPVELTEGA